MSENINLQATIAATPDAVFRALTAAEELAHWFAEHAEVSEAEGRYDFWGRLTPENPNRENGHHRILAWEPSRRLAYHWRLRGAETTATITLEPQGKATLLTLAHLDIPSRPQRQWSMQDFWELGLENLCGWVERHVVGARADFSIVQYGDVQLGIGIDAPREAVFHALMTPEDLNRYFATNATVEPYVGGRYGFGWGIGGPVKILELAPPEKLAYSWDFENEPHTVVTWTLENSGGSTWLTLVHSGFGPEHLTDEYGVGWLNCLNQIKFLVEVGPTWKKPTAPAIDQAHA